MDTKEMYYHKRFFTTLHTCRENEELDGRVALSFNDLDKVDYAGFAAPATLELDIREKGPEEFFGYDVMAAWAMEHYDQLFGWDGELDKDRRYL